MSEPWIKRDAVAVHVAHKTFDSAKARALFAEKKDAYGDLMAAWRANGIAEKVFDVIYFVKMGDLGVYKIGKAGSAYSRLDGLQTSSPYKLTMSAMVSFFDPTHLMSAERHAHSLAARHGTRVRGEWFKLTPAAIGLIIKGVGDKFPDEIQAVSAMESGI